MRNRVTAFACAFACVSTVHAQFGRGAAEWSTSGGDAHRSSAVASDAKISKDSMSKPGFALFWKMKLPNEARALNALTAPTLMDRHIGIHGFRSFGFVTGSGNNVYAVDTDLARIDWQKNFGKPAAETSMTCPGGMTTGTARSISAAFPAVPQGGGGRGRGTPAKSGVGEAGEGGVTLVELQRAAAAAAAAPGRGGAAGRGPGGPGGGRGARMAVVVNSLSSDGMFHANFVSNGDEPTPAIKFLPPNANAQGLIIVDNVAYVATVNGCGGVANGLWALDIASKEVTSWKPQSGEVAGSAGATFGGDGTVYVATTTGDMVSLEPKTLKVKDVHRAGQAFTSSPVIFQHKEKTMIAATTKDGRLHLVDAAAMSGAGVNSAPYSTAGDFVPGALATWEDAAGTRWILAPSAGAVSADAKLAANGSVTNGAVVAWKVGEQNGAPTLEAGWASRDLVSPITPLVINGVVFAVSSGEFRSSDAKMTAAQRAQKSVPAVVYALDAATGKELWSSGKTMTSFVHGGGMSGASGQIYLGTHDGTLYSFGFPIEH